ncbi:MAG: hypothetical protein AB7S46_04565, partial [Flavobacteriaceae bacterium]
SAVRPHRAHPRVNGRKAITDDVVEAAISILVIGAILALIINGDQRQQSWPVFIRQLQLSQ